MPQQSTDPLILPTGRLPYTLTERVPGRWRREVPMDLRSVSRSTRSSRCSTCPTAVHFSLTAKLRRQPGYLQPGLRSWPQSFLRIACLCRDQRGGGERCVPPKDLLPLQSCRNASGTRCEQKNMSEARAGTRATRGVPTSLVTGCNVS